MTPVYERFKAAKAKSTEAQLKHERALELYYQLDGRLSQIAYDRELLVFALNGLMSKAGPLGLAPELATEFDKISTVVE